jgi:hypothetical protein
MEIEEISAKARACVRVKEPDDLDLDCRGGVIPCRAVHGTPELDSLHEPKIGVPESIRASISKRNESNGQ